MRSAKHCRLFCNILALRPVTQQESALRMLYRWAAALYTKACDIFAKMSSSLATPVATLTNIMCHNRKTEFFGKKMFVQFIRQLIRVRRNRAMCSYYSLVFRFRMYAGRQQSITRYRLMASTVLDRTVYTDGSLSLTRSRKPENNIVLDSSPGLFDISPGAFQLALQPFLQWFPYPTDF